MEEFVSFEVAQLAHKLGFDEKVLYGIKESGEHFAGKSVYNWNGDRTTTCYSCPSHGHLYKWIMKHGIYIDIETIISRGKVAFKVVIQYGKCLKCVKVLPKNYECYYAAWNAGLLYALELICEGHEHCKHDDCCDEHKKDECCEKEHEHCEHKHEHCEHGHKHEDCDEKECEDHCKRDDDDCCEEHKEEHHSHEHNEHHEHHSFEITPGGIKDEDSEDDESDKKSHDKKSDKGK